MGELYGKGEMRIELQAGKLVLIYDGKGADMSVALEVDYFMDKLKEAIPGEIDDAIIEIVKAALKAA